MQPRAIALAVALAVAAGGARARADAPSSGVTPPAGWRALPKVAAALADGAKTDGVAVEASEAWGDPGRGCFAVWLAVRGAGAATADQLVTSLAGPPTTPTVTAKKFTVRDVAPRASSVTLAFEREPFRGRLRATLDGDAVRALACFGDGREPAACDAACATVVSR